MKKFIQTGMSAVFLAGSLWALSVQAQLRYTETGHDFGTIAAGTTVSHDFILENRGGRTLTLNTPVTSCRCMTTRLERELKPGKSTALTVSLNSTGQKGQIQNSVQVSAEGSDKMITFVVSAQVEEASRGQDQQGASRDTVGKLVFDKISKTFGELKTGADKEIVFEFENIGKETVKFNEKIEHKGYFSAVISPMAVKPGQKGTVKVTFLGNQALKEGLDNDSPISELIGITTQDPKAPKVLLSVTANYKRVYSEAELANAPTIQFETTDYRGGEIIQGQALNYSFKFTNTGKSDLIIGSAKASCGCTATAPKEKVIAPGKTSQIDIQFDSKGKMGEQHKTVTVKTNDPKNRTIVLNFRCKIIEDPFSGGGKGGTLAPAAK